MEGSPFPHPSHVQMRSKGRGRLPIALSPFLSLVLCPLSLAPFCVRIQVLFQELASELLSLLNPATGQ